MRDNVCLQFLGQIHRTLISKWVARQHRAAISPRHGRARRSTGNLRTSMLFCLTFFLCGLDSAQHCTVNGYACRGVDIRLLGRKTSA